MRYLGGKRRLGKYIAPILKKYAPPEKYKVFVEPFCGSLGITTHMVDDYKCYISDYNKSLIMLWKEVKAGTFKYPKNVSFRTYIKYKNDPKPSAMKAFVGFGCSFGGMWFNGYCKKYTTNCDRDHIQESVRGIQKIESYIKKIKSIKHCSYENWNKQNLRNCLIYCDPPYQDTTSYKAVNSFDSIKFWDMVRKWSKHNIVIVSEFKAPKDFKCVWKKERAMKDFGNPSNNSSKKTEKLFIHRSHIKPRLKSPIKTKKR